VTGLAARLMALAVALEQGTDDVDRVAAAWVLRELADDLPAEHPTRGTDRELTDAGLPDVLWPGTRRDLADVDALERRLRAMPMPTPRAPDMTAADVLAPWFTECRRVIVHWYAHQWRQITTMPATLFIPKGDTS
jgi:hypothetical protein